MRTKSIIVIFVLTATTSCMCAPSVADADTLKRPSPINPAIPMDPKPAEKITVITDPKELAKIKREIKSDATESTITAPTTVQPRVESTFENHQEDDERKTSANTENQDKHRQKRAYANDDATTIPLIYRDQHKQPAEHKQLSEAGITATPQTLVVPIPPPEHQLHSEHLTVTPNEKPQNLPIYYDAGKRSEMKRDIPVPLVPKYHHPEETPKDEGKHDDHLQTSTTTSSSVSSTSTSSTTPTGSTTTRH